MIDIDRSRISWELEYLYIYLSIIVHQTNDRSHGATTDLFRVLELIEMEASDTGEDQQRVVGGLELQAGATVLNGGRVLLLVDALASLFQELLQ